MIKSSVRKTVRAHNQSGVEFNTSEQHWDPIKQLACAVLMRAVEDFTTLPHHEFRQGRGRRPHKKKTTDIRSNWATARNLLNGREPGPRKRSMMDFICELADMDPEAIREKLNIDKEDTNQ